MIANNTIHFNSCDDIIAAEYLIDVLKIFRSFFLAGIVLVLDCDDFDINLVSTTLFFVIGADLSLDTSNYVSSMIRVSLS